MAQSSHFLVSIMLCILPKTSVTLFLAELPIPGFHKLPKLFPNSSSWCIPSYRATSILCLEMSMAYWIQIVQIWGLVTLLTSCMTGGQWCNNSGSQYLHLSGSNNLIHILGSWWIFQILINMSNTYNCAWHIVSTLKLRAIFIAVVVYWRIHNRYPLAKSFLQKYIIWQAMF